MLNKNMLIRLKIYFILDILDYYLLEFIDVGQIPKTVLQYVTNLI